MPEAAKEAVSQTEQKVPANTGFSTMHDAIAAALSAQEPKEDDAPAEAEEQEDTAVGEDSPEIEGQEAEEEQEEASEEEAAPEPEKKAVEAPKTDDIEAFTERTYRMWTKEQRAKWDSVPPEAQDALKDILQITQKNMAKGLQKKLVEAAETKKQHSEITDIFKPYQGQLQKLGYTPKSYIEAFIGHDKAMTVDPAGTILTLMDKHNVKPSDLGLEDAEFDTEKKKLRMENAKLRMVQPKETVPDREAQLEQINSMVEDFISATDDDGNVKYPHAENKEVTEEMAALIDLYNKRGVKLTLEQAYLKSPTAKELGSSASKAVDKKAEQGRRAAEAKKKRPIASGKPAHTAPANLSRAQLIEKELMRQGAF